MRSGASPLAAPGALALLLRESRSRPSRTDRSGRLGLLEQLWSASPNVIISSVSRPHSCMRGIPKACQSRLFHRWLAMLSLRPGVGHEEPRVGPKDATPREPAQRWATRAQCLPLQLELADENLQTLQAAGVGSQHNLIKLH